MLGEGDSRGGGQEERDRVRALREVGDRIGNRKERKAKERKQ